MQDRFADTQCIAEEFIIGCNNIICRSTDDAEILKGNIARDCNFIDCETLECNPIVVETPEIMLLPGFMTELTISELNGLPSGVFVVDEIQSPFECILIAVD